MARSFQNTGSNLASVNTSFSEALPPSQETNANTVNTSFTSYDGAMDPDVQYPRLPQFRSTTICSLRDQDLLGITSKPETELFESREQTELARISRDSSLDCMPASSSRDQGDFGDIVWKTEREPGPVSPPNLKSGILADIRQASDLAPVTNLAERSQVGGSVMTAASLARRPDLESPRSSTLGDSPSRMAYFIRELPSQNLFIEPLPRDLLSFPYFLLFICCRISISNGISLRQLMQSMDVSRVQTNPDIFWNTFGSHIRIEPRDPNQVWAARKRSFEGYTFKGKIIYNRRSAPSGSVFQLELMPIAQEKSSQIQRMFGSDRFLYLTYPSFSEGKPERFTQEQMQQIEERWKVWMLQTHDFLGRKWRYLHLEPTKSKTNDRKASSDKRVILFATEGVGIEKPMSVGEVINGFIDLARNREENFCKAYARLDLGLSRTTPTLEFKPSQIKVIPDKFSNNTPEATEFNDPNLDWSDQCKKNQVMNDGCARVSVGAALKIWEHYQSATGSDEPLPSAFQGRIRGAKGMWMVSSEPHTKDQAHLDIWIEITTSQLKFKPTDNDEDDNRYNPHRLTFNYVKHSSVNGSADLHIDFIPILVDRGVQKATIANLMITRLDKERKQLLDMVQDPVKLHNWATKQGSATSISGILPWQAALPLSLSEKAKLLLRTGFAPAESPYLARTLKQFIKHHHNFMEQKLRAPLGKATSLLGLADPESVLSPGEVHVRFSSPFFDDFSRKTFRHLDGLEVLVARQPACRPSDIQKVRAVSHPKLSHLVDVIVFPVQGQFPLAGKLQGGDYDGDNFWTCWEPDLVEPFRNAPAPLVPPEPTKYGIEKDIRRLDQVMDPHDLSTVDNFLKEALDFRATKSMLGQVTNFLSKVAYQENRIFSDKINALCDVHDLLIDAPKQAFRFNNDNFNNLVRYQLKCGNPMKPAYKQAMEANAKSKEVGEGGEGPVGNLGYKPNNILDYLYFEVVRKHNNETRRQLDAALPKEEDDSPELQLPFTKLRDKGSVALNMELNALLVGIQEIYKTWNRGFGDRSGLTPDKYEKLLEKCYASFRLLVPSDANASDPDIAPLIFQYLDPPHPTLWEYIRASALYTTYPKRHAFVWNMAGRELAKLKAGGDENCYYVAPGIFADLKTKPNKVPKLEKGEEENSEDEFEDALEHIIG